MRTDQVLKEQRGISKLRPSGVGFAYTLFQVLGRTFKASICKCPTPFSFYNSKQSLLGLEAKLIMKKLIILLCLIFINLSLGQSYKKNRKVVPLLVSQNFYLNGATKGAFGGNSRTSLLISLPRNTVEWYYVISTSPNQSNNLNLNLVSQLTRLLDQTGMTAIMTSSVLAPSGNGGACDVFLMDRRNKDDFIRKVDVNCGILWGYN